MKNKFITLLLLISLFTPTVSNAQIPFGGKIIMVIECACSGGWMMYVYDKSKFMVYPIVFQFGISRLNQNFNIFMPGVNVVGSFFPGGVCVIASTSCSTTIPAIGTVTTYPFPGIGTSLLPSPF